MTVLDMSKRHHRFFEEIARIPHGSFHEKQISDYFVSFARERGLSCVQDAMNNVVIYKKASPGYEDHPTVALQAHMDMVWEKDEGYEHDFLTDPIRLKIEDGYLTAEHTTLGIDDGSGVAYILAILDDEQAKHPPLEAIFTVQEEVGMYGALALDKSLVTASRFISLDCGGGDSIYVSSLGGRAADLSVPLTREAAAEDAGSWKVTVSGLRNFYSTTYLTGAENAIELGYEIIDRLNARFGLRISSFCGGGEGGKAAGTAEIRFLTGAAESALRAEFEQIVHLLRKDCRFGEPKAAFTLEPCEAASECYTRESSDRLIDCLGLLPCGAVQYNGHDQSLIGAVCNWTRAASGETDFALHLTIRAESNRKLELWTRRLETLCRTQQWTLRLDEGFPAWEFDPASELCGVLKEVFRRRCGRELGTIEVQGGIECSIFRQIGREMDMITIGPFGEFEHTTREHCLLESYDRIFDVFVDFLAAL